MLEHIDELVSIYDRGACSASDCFEYIDAVYNEIVLYLPMLLICTSLLDAKTFINFGGMKS